MASRPRLTSGSIICVTVSFPDNDSALMYLEKIRKKMQRYARDQFLYIRKCVERADVDIAGKTLRYCIDNGIYDAKDFEAVLNMYLGQLHLHSLWAIAEFERSLISESNKKVIF